MGVGVLIGRAGNGKSVTTPPAQVITVGTPSSGSGGSSTSEATFTGDWPSAKSGYTVQLQTLSEGSSVSAVEAAKSAASGKGAKSVGALKSEEFSSLTTTGYVIYSGEYSTRAEAEKALPGLKKSFPQAKVIHVSGSSSSTAGGGEKGASSSGKGSTPNKPASPSALKNLNNSHGKSYEEKSKNLPDVVETG